MVERLTLPSEPDLAVRELLAVSHRRPVLLFKKSPTCPVSHGAEEQLHAWLDGLDPGRPLAVAIVDVIDQRALARGITAALDIEHQSPQALLFHDGAVRWYDSHRALTATAFEAELDRVSRRA